MARGVDEHQRRYRRRIIGLGAVLFVLCFLIPAPFVIDWVEDDLESRTSDELTSAGFDGVTVTFSGQDGTVRCAAPVDDVGQLRDLIEDEWGVRTVDVGESCRGTDDSADTVSDTDTDTDTDDDSSSTEVATTAATVDTTTTTPASTTTVAPEISTIASIISEDPQFSQLAGLLERSGLDATLANGGPVTLFAPTDDAFDTAFEQLGPDAFAELTADAELVERVLLHHVTEGSIAASDLASGELDMLDGTRAVVEVSGGDVTLTSGDTVAAVDAEQRDVVASNGVVHAIDMVLLPADVTVGAPVERTPDITATWSGGRVVLSGSVASEGQRGVLADALVEVVDAANLDDQLVVDENSPVGDEDIDRLAAVVAAMPDDLVEGTATLTGTEIAVVGTDAGPDAATAFETVAAEVDASLELASRVAADDDSASALQDELNEIVRLDPIVFEPNSAELTADSIAVVDRVAAVARSLGGTSILVVGHTDSDGQPATNQQLSEDRAAAVVTALVERGADVDSLSSEGRGQTEPILVDGVEDKDASRRVEFVVTAT